MTLPNEKIKKLVGYNMKIEQLLLKVTKHEDDKDFIKEVEGYGYIPKYILYSIEKEGLLNEFDVFQIYKIIFNKEIEFILFSYISGIRKGLKLKLKLKLKLTVNSICVRLGVISRVLYFYSSGSYFCVEWRCYAW